jgi:imidazolonepropionase-like amidohydrolase
MSRSRIRTALFLGLLGSIAWLGGVRAETLVLRGGTVYTSPDAAAIANAVVVMSDGVITAVGSAGDVQSPGDARVIDCTGKTIVAGFWNSHVHFTNPVWTNAATAPAATLTAYMQQMLTKWGFTTVWDLGSEEPDSLALRRRIYAGEILGPNILLAGNIFPKGGHPVYLPADLQLPEAATPSEATQIAGEFMAMGVDGIKLFTGSSMGNGRVVNMDVAVAKAAVDVAHARGKPVFAHPQNKTGMETVIAAQVDVMAHIVPGEPGYGAEELARFKAQHTALIPTLALFSRTPAGPVVAARLIDSGVAQIKAFTDNGGPVLFGTDVGFIDTSDTTLEVELMHRALSERQILATLTTTPAAYFKATRKGKVLAGFDADITVLEGDFTADVRNLARVAYTIRAGKIIFEKP